MWNELHIFELRMKIEIMRHHHSYVLLPKSSCEKKAWKNLGLNGIQTHDLCDTGAVLYQLSYPASYIQQARHYVDSYEFTQRSAPLAHLVALVK